MESCEELLENLRQYVDTMAMEGKRIRRIQCLPNDKAGSSETSSGSDNQVDGGVVLQENTAVELGNPKSGSSSFLLWSTNIDLINDGQITLIGPDIIEVVGQSLPFGQILLIGSAGLEKELVIELARVQYLSHNIEGYMVRSTPRYLWSRINKHAVEKGFSFKTLGQALILASKMKVAKDLCVEVIFVTSSKEDIVQLDAIGSRARETIMKLKKSMITNLIDCAGEDCSDCPEKPTCDNVREIKILRERKIFNRLA